MPSSSEHLRQARHNFQLLEDLAGAGLREGYPDWVVTISFYAAVHYVEAGVNASAFLYIRKNRQNTKVDRPQCALDLAKQAGYATSAHYARDYVLDWNPKAFPGCREPYSDLLELSKLARYTAQQIPQEDSQLALDSVGKIRGVIEAFLEKLSAA